MAGIHDLAKTAGVSDDIVKSVMNAIVTEANKGGSVTLVGFGTFKISTVAARTFQNPSAPGKTVKKAAHKKLSFKASKNLEL